MLPKKCILQVTQETSNTQFQMPSSKEFRKSHFPKYCQYYWHLLKTKTHTTFLLYFPFTSPKRVTFPTSPLEEALKECVFMLHLIWSNYRCPTPSYLTFPLLHHSKSDHSGSHSLLWWKHSLGRGERDAGILPFLILQLDQMTGGVKLHSLHNRSSFSRAYVAQVWH